MRIVFIFISFFMLASVAAFSGTAEVIVLSPGHGGYDSGIKTGNLKEKDVALSIAKQMDVILSEFRKKVYLTRKIDQYLTLGERASIANIRRPDAFLAVHMSESESFAVYTAWYERDETEIGLSEYYSASSRQRRHLYQSGLLADSVGDALHEVFGGRVLRRRLPLPVLTSIGAPAILVEVPAGQVEREEGIYRVSSALVLGLMEYERQRQ